MNGKIFVHIGLPKTATTTLQMDFFPALQGETIHYLGVIQPRNIRVQENLYIAVCEAISSGLLIDEARGNLKAALSSGSRLILSEEMITVSQPNVSWRTKLENLSKILCDLDYTIILTVREPTSAIFSYYIELYRQFSKTGLSFLDLAKNDERMHIFHYGKLTEVLLRHFERDRVFMKKFEDITSGKLDDLYRLITSGSHFEHSIQIHKHNEKKKDKGHTYTGKNVTLADMLRRFLLLTGLIDTPLASRAKGIMKPVISALDRMTIGKQKVIQPSQQEIQQLRDYLRGETLSLEKHFGIKYE